MTSKADLKKEEIVNLLQRCWMTHDGMWFFHSMKEFGIEKANRLNKDAIRSLAPMEISRIKEAIGFRKDRIESFQELKDFFIPVSELFIPDFMNITMSFPKENVLSWEFAPNSCFAFKGMKRIGAIEKYECGVIYRLTCWFDALRLKYKVTPKIEGCLMLKAGKCSGRVEFEF